MPIPSTQEIRKPLLEAFKGEAPHNFAIKTFLEMMAGYFNVDLNEMSSGDKNIFCNRIKEAKSDLKKFHLLSNPSKSTYMITRTGLEILGENPNVITDEYLIQRTKPDLFTAKAPVIEAPVVEAANEIVEPVDDIQEVEEISEPEIPEAKIPDETQEEIIDAPEPEAAELQEEVLSEPVNEDFSEKEFNEAPDEYVDNEISQPEPELEQAPDETDENEISQQKTQEFSETPAGIEEVLAKYNSDLAEEILSTTASIHSDNFEKLVIDLLSKMGYRAFQNARYTTETAGSDLIHGVILEDKAGLTPIYIHARKLSPNRTVGRADIEDFAEALRDKGGKGIFATTGNFSEQAVITAADERIMLIDGIKLAGLMIANNFCVNVEKVFELKAIDSESFSEYEE